MKKLQITLTPSESKRLIAIGVKRLPIVENALKNGIIVISLGTTNAFIAEELLGKRIEKERFAAGIIDGRTCIVPKEKRLKEIVIKKGSVVDEDVIDELSPEDVFIKGANAIDPQGVAGILLANPTGGTIGKIIGTVMARGVNFLIPVGLEKSVLYPISEAAKRIGNQEFEKSMGIPVGLMPVHGIVFTEIEALKMLGAEDAFQIGAGGIGGGEGSVTLCVEGEEIDDLLETVMKIKDEERIKSIRENCSTCERKPCLFSKN
ncbi:MAG: hypothetical protein ACXQTD_00995 [Candidatus Syntropharchaeia archaeon]